MDTVDANFTHEWLDNIQKVLGDRKPDYLIVQHMEPDHAANIANFPEGLSGHHRCFQQKSLRHDAELL